MTELISFLDIEEIEYLGGDTIGICERSQKCFRVYAFVRYRGAGEKLDEMRSWLANNLTSKYDITMRSVGFADPGDAVTFSLRFR